MEPEKHSDNTALMFFFAIPVIHVAIWVLTVVLGDKIWQ